MLPANPSFIRRYSFAIGATVLALLLSLLLQPLDVRSPFLLFFIPVVFAAWYGGLGPSLVATVLSILFTDLFLLPHLFALSLDTPELIRVITFGGVAVLVSTLYRARQRSEAQLQQRLNTLSSIYELSNAVNQTSSIPAIYEHALDALRRAIGADRASILLCDAQGVMQFQAWRGLSEAYRTATTGHSPWTAETKNPQPLLVPDVETEPTLQELRGVIRAEGIRALGFIPLVTGDRLLGKFMVYFNQPHTFAPEQVQAAETIARHVVFALERQRTEEDLRQSRRQLEIILHGITDGITVQDPTGKLIYANETAAHTLGFSSPQELIATPVQQVMSKFQMLDEAGQPLPLSRLPGRLALQGRQPSEELVRFRVVETGAEHWSAVSAAPVFDPAGRVLFAINMFRDFTERRRAEEAERAQRELWQVTLASIGDAVIATNGQARVTFMNPVAEALTGWAEEEAQGQALAQVFQIINEETRQPVENPATQVLARGAIVGLANHTLLIRRDGRELPVDDSGAPIRDKDGNVVGVVLVFRDVTAQRRAQIEMGRLAAIVESSEDAIHAKTLDGIITSWNQAAERLYGYTADEIIGQSAGLLIPPDQPTELAEILAQIRKGVSVKPFETQRWHKDGRLLDVLVTISPIKNGAGEIVGASTIARDIAERKQAEAERARLYATERAAREEAETAQQRLTILADASQILSASLDYETTLTNVARLIVPRFADWCGVFVVQEDGTINQLAVAHVDPTKVELIHQLQRRFPFDPNADRGVPHVIRTGQPELVTEIPDALLTRLILDPELLQIVRELGFRSSMVVPLVGRERVVGALSFASAESGRIYGASDLALAQELAGRAAVAIDNARLYKQVETALEVRDQFFSLASHELKTPITSIMGFAELIQRRTAHATALTENDHRALQLIYGQSARLAQLISSMLDLSRIEAGHFSIEHAPVDLSTLSRKTVEDLHPTLERHTLTYSGPAEPLVVQGDALRLEQVLQNLIQNAIKYSPRGGPVRVTLEHKAEMACLTVSDQGIGIPEAMQQHLFTRFYRADNATALRISGVGIGLFVVKQIVTLHGGRVEVESREGAGSTFRVYLPLTPARVAAPQPATWRVQ